MNEKVRKELTAGLPLSSNIAVGILRDVERKYEADVADVREKQRSFDERRQQAFLTARYGRLESGHLFLSGLSWGGHPLTYTLPEERTADARCGWVFEHEVIPETVCQKANLAVGTGIESRDWSQASVRKWSVWAWIPPDLSRDHRPEVCELLPLPEGRLEEWEWLLVFCAMAKVTEASTESPRPEIYPPTDDSWDPKENTGGPIRRLTYRLWPAKLQRRGEEIVIEEFLGDVSRFREGRDIVINALLRECVGCSLQRAREKTQFDLIVFDGSERPAFLPTGWDSQYWPLTDTPAAFKQWVSCTRETLAQWEASLEERSKTDDVVSIELARQACADANRIAGHIQEKLGIKDVPPRQATDGSLSAVIGFLADLGQALSESPGETLARESLLNPNFITVVGHEPTENMQQNAMSVAMPTDFAQFPDYGGVIVETQDFARVPEPPSSMKEQMRGVSLLDAAAAVSEGDDTAAQEAKKRWQRTQGCPTSIGHDLNQPQTELFEVGPLAEWIVSLGEHGQLTKKALKEKLNRIRRPCVEHA